MKTYKIIDNLTNEQVIIKTAREWIVMKHLQDNYYGSFNKIFKNHVTVFVSSGNDEEKLFKPY